MSIKLKGTTAGSAVILAAPSDTSPTGTEKTFTLPTQDGDAGQILKTDGSGALSFTDNLASNRNLIINGDCRISQRGTSFANVSNGDITLDRFKINKSSAAALTVTQESDGPADFNKSIKIATTTADTTLDAGDFNILQYNIEGLDLQHLNYGTSDAKSTTLSFWVKSNMTGNLSITSEVNSGPPYLASSVTINSANTWEYKTITFIGNTATAIDDDNTAGIEFQIWLDAGTNFSSSGQNTTSWNNVSEARVNSTNQINLQGSTSNYIQFTGFQYEVGSVATAFEHRSYGEEISRCERYFQTSFEAGQAPAHGIAKCIYQMIRPYSGTSITGIYDNYRVEMRATPSVTTFTSNNATSSTNGHISYYDGNWKNASINLSGASSTKYLGLGGTLTSGTTLIQYNYTADAEL